MTKLQSRYPGARPFETEQQLIFKGRQEETQALFQKIQLENLVVLYGKSGTGKSSLLNAGIIPKIKAETVWQPIRVRFNAWSEGAGHAPPAETARLSVRGGQPAHRTFLDKLIADEASLWHDVKEHFVRHDGQKGLLLVIDQFEELFTYPPEQVAAFGEQLAEAMFKAVPQRYWDILQAAYARGERPLDADELALFQHAPMLKVVLSIRSDRVHLLNRLEPQLPAILKHLYELDALSPDSARQAITEPAAMPRMDWFDTEPFLYEPAAIEAILDFLTQEKGGETPPNPPEMNSGQALKGESSSANTASPPLEPVPNSFREGRGAGAKIEATQLQIICSVVEKRVAAGNLKIVRPAQVADLEAIIEQYYENQILELPDDEQLPARRLIEEGLVFEEEERRLSLYEGQIFKTYKIRPETLRQLVDAHLLRAEPSLNGGYTYELSHDTLVAPVLKAKNIRLEAERREAEALAAAQREAELAAARAEAAREKRRRRRAAMLAWGAGLAAVLALGVGIFALNQWKKAQFAEQKAVDALEQVKKEQQIAETERKKAEESFHLAQQKTEEAETEADNARRALDEQKKALAEIARRTIRDAQKQIYGLDYEAALRTLKTAVPLNVAQREVGEALLELVFFYAETNRPDSARTVLNLAAPLLNGKAGTEESAADFRTAIRRLAPARLDSLMVRYLPNIQSLPGGSFLMGRNSTRENGGDDELPRHEVQLSPFGLAATETTFWQWGLYIADKRRDISRYSPTWNISGDNPAVNMDWFDACEYANWLSEHEGKKPFYRIDSTAGPNERHGWKVELLPDGTGYRLPTEAEWEYAARGGPGTPYNIYAGSDSLNLVGWYGGNSSIGGIRRTNAVGQKQPVVFPGGQKIYDLSGNVWEWCWDGWDENYYELFRSSPAKNPLGPADWTNVRVLRGGSWYDDGYICRSALRYGSIGSARLYYRGFRLARH